MNRRLDGKVAVVTGATQGLGAAVARRFVGEGVAGIVLGGRDHDRGTDIAGQLNRRTEAVFVSGDLADVGACQELIAEADRRFGRIDVLVNVAALTVRGTILDTTPELFDQMMAVNVRAPFFLMQEAIKVMQREGIAGSIVNIGSQSGYGGQPYLAPYATSKGALMMLTRNVAYAVAWSQIRVNALNIGWMDTEGEDLIQRRFHTDGQDWLEEAEERQPFQRLLKPEEVAAAVAFIASSESGMMTGSVVDFNQAVMGAGDPPTPTREDQA